MDELNIEISDSRQITKEEVVHLYQANQWSSAQKPKALHSALINSHRLITARLDGKLIGLGNAISDGHLVVYYPHLLVHPDHQGKGIGALILQALQEYQRTLL